VNTTAEPARPAGVVRARSIIIILVGMGLSSLAVWFATRGDGGGALLSGWEAARAAPWTIKAAALLLPVANWILTSLVFLTLTRAHGRVGAVEMGALIGAAGLYNYMPLRPGLIGRVAYHRAINDIPVMSSVRVLATTIALSGAGVMLLIVSSLGAARLGTHAQQAAVIAAPILITGVLAWYARSRGLETWRLGAALVLRYVDLLVWTARYTVVFALIGRPLDGAQAAAIAAVSQVASVIPLAGNGLGLREWAVAWCAASLPAWYTAGPAAPSTGVGLSADLLHRAAELPAAFAIGLLSTAWLSRRLTANRIPRHDAAS